MTTPTDAQSEYEQAERDAQEAEGLVADLEARLASGDASVTPEQLDEQHRLVRWARLNAKGAATRRAKAEADAARAAAQAAVDQVAGAVTTDAELVDAWSRAVEAMRVLAATAATRNQVIADNQTLLTVHDAKLRQLKVGTIADYGAHGARFANETGYRIPDRGVDVSAVGADKLIATAVETGVAGIVQPSTIGIVSGRQLVGSTLTGRIAGWDDAAKAVTEQTR